VYSPNPSEQGMMLAMSRASVSLSYEEIETIKNKV
jgi:hypothetical protein